MRSKAAPHQPSGGSVSFLALVLLAGLLVVPSMACTLLANRLDPRLIVGHVLFISGITLWAYWRDKRNAVGGAWRTPESALHLAEFLGGWPAAFLAQRAFRHKISKTGYQATYWLIVLLHQAVALDALNGWKVSKVIVQHLQR